MSVNDESASAIVGVLTRLDMRLAAIEAKMDAVLAVMAQADGDAPPVVEDRRKTRQAFAGVDRRMGEV